MHNINSSAPQPPPSGDSFFKCIAWSLAVAALVVGLVFVFALGWPTLVSP